MGEETDKEMEELVDSEAPIPVKEEVPKEIEFTIAGVKDKGPLTLDEVEEENALKSDVEMTEPAKTDDILLKPGLIDDDEDEDDEPLISAQVIEEYRQMIQGLDPIQPVFTILDESHYLDALFPELVLYTAPDPECIGNDPYFDEAEYSRIVPFKFSAQRFQFQEHRFSRKRHADGTQVEQLPRLERYDSSFDVSCKLSLFLHGEVTH